MATTLWMNEITGTFLTVDELCERRVFARGLYAANSHVFEDELDALGALGIVPEETLHLN